MLKTLGTTSISKLKKSELVDAIVAAKDGLDKGAASQGGIRSRKASSVPVDSIDALASEQDSFESNKDAQEIQPRPMSRPRRTENANDSKSKSDDNSTGQRRENVRFDNDREDSPRDDSSSRRRRRRGSRLRRRWV